jgi:RimJ/RimL family protein N-acetyltransferase
VLRQFVPQDAPAVAAICNDATIAANLRDAFPHPYNLADAEEAIARYSKAYTSPSPTDHVLAITVDGAVAGSIGLHPRPAERRVTVELGFLVGAAYRGQGVATEAVMQAVDKAWSLFPGALRLEAHVYSSYVAVS